MYEADEETRRFMEVRNYLSGVVRRRNKQPKAKRKNHFILRLPNFASWRVACPATIYAVA